MQTPDETSHLRTAITALEAQRPILGDAVVETALGPMREKLAALEAAAEPAQQRKLATILFMDIAGHTQAVRDLDPEENLAIIDRALARLAEPVAQFGGRVVRFQGDGFKAVFGLPTAQENDPEKAVRAALKIQETAAQIASELAAEQAMSGFKVRIGINTGLIVGGGLTEGEDSVSGMPVNLAARLESAAEPGTILISHDTYRHIRGVFDVQALEPLTIKDIEGPVQVYMILQAKPRAFRLATRGVEGVETRMIGRDTEYLLLQAAYTDAMEASETRVVIIEGDAGIGKSRLLYEFDNWIELRPEQIFYFKGRATPTLQSVPFSLFRDLFAFRFDILDSDTPAVAREKFRTGMVSDVLSCNLTRASSAPEETGKVVTTSQADIAGHWLGFDFSASTAVGKLLGNPEFGIVAQSYLTRYFRWLTTQPTVIFLEDIHWADDGSLDLVTHLATSIPEAQLLIVAVARPSLFERRPLWGEGEAAFRRISLTPLSRRASRALVEEILQRVDDLPDVLRDLIVEAAEGNPFYVEEVVKMLIDQGVIVAGEQRGRTAEEINAHSPEDCWYVLTEKLDAVRVPPTLIALLQARLDGLPRPEREALQRAAVVGRLFWDDAVANLAQTERQSLQSTLESIRERELVFRRERSTFANAEEYLFKHALLRDVAYETVLLRYRREFHARVARWLEAHAGERLSEYLGLIAEHYNQAGDHGRAAAYLERSGEEALRSGAFGAARASLERALSLREAAGKVEDTAATAALLRLGEACWKLGDYRAAEMVLHRALWMARRDEDGRAQVEALYWLSLAADSRGEYESALALLNEALPLAQPAGGTMLARVLNGLAAMDWRTGELDAGEARARHSLELAREAGDSVLELRALSQLGILASVRSDHELAQHYYEAGLALARETGNREREAISLVNLGDEAERRGDLVRARDYGLAALDMLSEMGIQESIASALLNISSASIGLGDLTAARRYTGEALALAQKMGALLLELSAVYVFAELLSAEGETGRSLALLGMVRSHPAADNDLQQMVRDSLQRLPLDAAEVKAGLAAGASLDLDEAITVILSTEFVTE
jgi:predicted ATPase/class 3 adenylate cyclase